MTRDTRVFSWVLAYTCLSLAASLALPPLAYAVFPSATVADVHYDQTLRHNIPDLALMRDGQAEQAPFWQTYQATGGVTRWGFPTSEVLEEEEGSLTQYYQRGVMDWHRSPTCGTPSGYCMERRLAWDYFGGGSGGSVDQGVERGPTNPHPGPRLGPWGNGVSNVSTEGVETGFLDFFEQYGQLDSFGYPKTEARRDTNAPGALHIPAATPGFIRQYFQAAVMEYHSGDPEPVKLRLLGDDLRNLSYPDEAWKAYRSFRDAPRLNRGDPYDIERVIPGRRQVEASVAGLNLITERCLPLTWQSRRPFCEDATLFQPASLSQEIRTGDVVRTRNASPDFDIHSVLQFLQAGLVRGFAVLSTGARVAFGPWEGGAQALSIESGQVAITAEPGSELRFTTPDGEGVTLGTIFLVDVQSPPGGSTSTTVKVTDGRVSVRSGTTLRVIPTSQLAVLQQGTVSVPRSLVGLTSREAAQVQLLQQLQSRLGKAPAPVPVVRVVPESLTLRNTPTGQVAVGNAGGDFLSWTARPDAAWISVSPTAGRLPAQRDQTVQVQINTRLLPPSSSSEWKQQGGIAFITSTITFSSNGGTFTLPVRYEQTIIT